MSQIYPDNSRAIGHTPLVQLNRLPGCDQARILVKVEGRNPAYSVKCRVGAAMIWDAEERGLLREGVGLIEPTSGNTGIALAFVAAARGIPITLTMPETMSLERRKILKAFGAELILTPGAQGMPGAVAEAERLAAEQPERYVLLHQFRNPANPAIHATTTGPEIWRDCAGNIDLLISGVGTGGTLTGVSRYIKQEQEAALTTVAIEPENSPVISQHLAGNTLQPGPHKVQGIGAGFIPETLDLGMVDEVETISDAEALEFARRLALEEGILSGISSGAAAAVACRLAQQPQHQGKTLVAVLPDSGERYLSSVLFEEIPA